MTGNSRAVRLRVSGRVQGVGFRAWCRIEAEKLSLEGWVRNEGDGSVSALVAGPTDAVEEMIARLRTGPPAARVDRVLVEPADVAGIEPGFRIAR